MGGGHRRPPPTLLLAALLVLLVGLCSANVNQQSTARHSSGAAGYIGYDDPKNSQHESALSHCSERAAVELKVMPVGGFAAEAAREAAAAVPIKATPKNPLGLPPGGGDAIHSKGGGGGGR